MCVAYVTFLSALVYRYTPSVNRFAAGVHRYTLYTSPCIAMAGSKMFSADLLEDFNYRELEQTEEDYDRLLTSMRNRVDGVLSSANFMKDSKITRQVMADWLQRAVQVMNGQFMVMRDYKAIIDLMKIEAIADKTKVVNAQEKLLELKDEQLNTLTTAVQSTVQNSVEKEIKQYSQVLTTKSSGTVVSHGALKSVVKSALKEEDRSKNLVVFGLVEQEKEQLENVVGELLTDLGEKPRVSATRIGVKSNENWSKSVCRPVKLTLPNSSAAHQILLKAKIPKDIPKYKSVYICPDRSPEEKAARRALVTKVKEANEKQPRITHFIRNGKVHSVEKG